MKISGSILYWLFLILICALRPVSFLLVDVDDVNTSYGNSNIEYLEDLNDTENSDKFEYIDPNIRDEMPSTEDQQHIDGDNSDKNEIHSSFMDNLDNQNTVDTIQSGFQQILSEGVSQNSGALNEFTDTGQVLLTIVDTAGAELKSTAELTKSQSDVSYTDQHENINQSHSSASLPSHSVPLIPIKHSTSNLSDNNNDNFDDPDETFRNISLDENNNIVDLPEIIDETTTIVPSQEIETLDNREENDSTKLEADELSSSSEVAKDESIVVSSTPKAQDLEVKDKEDIPSFAEWAQKQLEEAEKKKEIQNISFQQNQQNQRNNGRHSTSNIKLRSKNYASPDCGAKIVAANSEATSPSLILSPSKDEYMLNTCNSRIWFVVELCEAVQAKRVELANFELFSSTPKDFSVYISDRYPTREWNSIGQFVAKDERDVQMYDLPPPYIFGKYVKVELNSHYGSEHYCPISLFRLYGTSEYEVLETEDFHHNQHNINHHTPESDDEDEFIEEELIKGKEGETSYLFGSAREVVMSFVKKAAQVLVMTSDSTTNRTTQRTVNCNLSKLPIITEKCQTPSHLIVCDNCSDLFFGNVYSLLSCRNNYLKYMSETYLILNALTRTDICSMYGLNFNSKETSCYPRRTSKIVSAFFGPEYIAALCNILAIREKKVVLNTSNSLLNNVIDDTFDNYSTTTESQKFNSIPDEHQVIETDQQIVLNESLSIGEVTTEMNPQLPSNEETEKILTENVDTVTKPEIESSESIWTTPSETDSHQILETNTPSLMSTELHHTETPPITPSKTIVDEISPTVQQNDEQQQRISTDTPSTSGENYEIVQEIDSFLSEWDQYPSNNNNPVATTPITPPSSMPQQGQKESVFVRLFNRIKALERNMSLSSQYLEELSRRYKKQMEEMQRSFDQILTVVKEESKKSEDFWEQCTDTQNRMNSQLATLTNTVEILMAERNSWTNVVSWFMHFFITQLFIVTIVLYFCGKSDTRKYSADSTNSDEQQKSNEVAIPKRRKSVDVVRHESPAKRRKRRPSEEALNITGTYNDLLIPDITEVDSKPWQLSKADKRRKRKKNAVLRRSNSNSTLVTTKIKQHPHRNVISTRSYGFVTTKQNFNIQNNSVNNIDDIETISIESVSSSSERITPPRRQENHFDRENVLAKLINPIVMKSAVAERKKRYSLQDNSTIEAATVPPRKDVPKQQKSHANPITNDKNLVLTNGSGNVTTRSNSVTSSSSNNLVKKEKKSGGLKKILKKVF